MGGDWEELTPSPGEGEVGGGGGGCLGDDRRCSNCTETKRGQFRKVTPTWCGHHLQSHALHTQFYSDGLIGDTYRLLREVLCVKTNALKQQRQMVNS